MKRRAKRLATKTAEPTFGEYLNLAEAERQLGTHYATSLAAPAVQFDLAKVRWLSPLTLSILYSWVAELCGRSKPVTLIRPGAGTFAGYFLDTTEFFAAVQALGVDVQGKKGRGGRLLADFQAFATRAEVAGYLTSLRDVPQLALLLHFEQPPDLVSSGHFQSVLLTELLDNAFIHGTGRNTHYCTFEAHDRVEGRREHELYAPFGGTGYVEVCVGDAGSQSVYDNLRDLCPSSYLPELNDASALDPVERVLMWAFEFGSTSQPGRRRAAIEKMVGPEQAERIEKIATGLYNVAQLTRGYGGQIILRTWHRTVSLDWSQAAMDGRGRARVWRRGLKQPAGPEDVARASRLPGTQVLIRVPKVPYKSAVVAVTRKPTRALEQPGAPGRLGVILPTTTTSAELILAAEQAVSTTGPRPSSGGTVLGLVFDGLNLDRKAWAVLLRLVARVPRRGLGLVLITSEAQMADIAAEQWQKEFQRAEGISGLLRPPSIVVASQTGHPVQVYGDTSQPDATFIVENSIKIPARHSPLPAIELVHSLRQEALAGALHQPAVRHSAGLFLVQNGGYYTQVFFEVRALLQDGVARAAYANWLRGEIQREAPSVIICGSRSLHPIVVDVATAARVPLVGQQREDLSQRSTQFELEAALANERRALVILDVLSRGRRVQELLSRVSSPDRVVVCCAVNAVDSSVDYLPLSRADRTVDVPVHAAVRERVRAITRRPQDVPVDRVIVIDPVLDRPTVYPSPKPATLSEREILQAAAAGNGLRAGHFQHAEKHAIYQVDLRSLVIGLRPGIVDWLRSEALEFKTTPHASPAATIGVCLDDATGLFEVAEAALRSDGFLSFRPIDRRELLAPPLGRPDPATALWAIVPRIESGDTIRSILHYGHAIGVGRVRVSGLFSMADARTLLFHQGVSEYHGARVSLGVFGAVGVPALRADACHVCALAQELDARSGALHGAPSCAKALANARMRIAVQPTLQADGHAAQSTDERILDEALTHGLFARAELDVRHARRELEELLKSERYVLAFVRGAGRCHERYLRNRDIVLYGNNPFPDALRRWLSTCRPEAPDLELYVRGFSALVPSEFSDAMRTVLPGLLAHDNALEVLIAEALRRPKLLGPLMVECLDQTTDVAHELSRELARVAAPAVRAIQDVHEGLLRSAGWNQTLLALEARLRLPNTMVGGLETLVERFAADGYRETRRQWHAAMASGGALSRLLELCPSLRAAWEQLTAASEQLLVARKNLAARASELGEFLPISDERVMDAVLEVQVATQAVAAAGRNLAAELDCRIGCRVADMTKDLRDEAKGAKWDAPFRVEVTDDCPPVAMLADDLKDVLRAFLENAHRRMPRTAAAPANGASVLFRFEGIAPDRRLVRLLMSAPFRDPTPERGEGGIGRARELVSYYGGVIERRGAVRDGVEGGQFVVEATLTAWRTDYLYH